jgi:hypothetical protein
MGSGPIIIADDGSPPPGALHPLRGAGIRVAREDEPMPELADNRAAHDILNVTISSVVVIQNGVSQTPATNVTHVKVSGAKTHIDVQKHNSDVRVATDMVLTPDTTTYAHWPRYRAGDAYIDTVTIDGTDRLKNCGNDTVKVEINF